MKSKLLLVGVTGGIGCGKTTVCNMFAKLGVPTLYSDQIAKDLYMSDKDIKKKIIKIFGEEAYFQSGDLNKKFLSQKIFSDKNLKRKIEAIVHPAVAKERERKINTLQQQGYKIILVEAALIYEAGVDKILDAVIVVDADESVRINRVSKRDALSEEKVRMIIDVQLDVKKKIALADYVIKNNGSLEELENSVRFLYDLFNKIIDKE